MEKVVIKKDNELVREWLDRIKLLLMKKAIVEKKPQNGDNRTIIGNCSFWFQKEHNGENFYLVFDRDPVLWDLDRIKNDLEQLEYTIYKQSIY